MTAQPSPTSDLTVPSHFIRAVRELGYLSLSHALAELVDNSLQAGATTVTIVIDNVQDQGWPAIQVEDNGIGMTRRELGACLLFGGSSRFDERSSFGRFGMGLPAASLSQARRVEVSSWQRGGHEYSVTLDVDAIANGNPADFGVAKRSPATSTSGCRVSWQHCDRIEYRRLAWLERALRRDLGRMFRRFLDSGLSLTVNGHPVDALDPMMLSTNVEGHAAVLPFEALAYELTASTGQTSFVRVRFAVLPVHRWHHLDNVTKRRIGIVGGGGVSILRAGREIAHGWHLMGAKRKENYDDWWRCEIEFEPALDEHFGITINKQGVRPSQMLRDALEPDMESIARLLNGRVRQAFEEVKFQAAAEVSCRIAESAEAEQPVLRTGRKGSGRLSYHIGTAQLPIETMFTTDLRSRTLEVRLNVDHPAFTALYRPLQAQGDGATSELRTALELFILAFARSTTLLADHQDQAELLKLWSATYGRMLLKS